MSADCTGQTLVENYRYIFVVGYGRSGSTLIQSILNSAAGVQIRGENNGALFHLFRAIKSVTFASPRTPDMLKRDNPWYGSNAGNHERFGQQMLLNFVREVLVPDPVARVIGFKEIRHTSREIRQDLFAPYIEFLLNRFPNSRIVFNSRRVEDAARSSFWAKEDTNKIVSLLSDAKTNFESFDQSSDRTIHMVYDEYIRDHTLIYRMLDFFDLNWTKEAVDAVFAKQLTH